MASEQDIHFYYNIALELVKQAGIVLIEGYSALKKIETKVKGFDFVTEYDKKVELILIKGLSKAFPSHKFFAEETASELSNLTDEPTWLIDPIDGTTNFIHNFPQSCISVALSVHQELVLGIVYNPSLNQLFTAQKGKGAYLNSSPIHTSKTTSVQESLIGFELSLAYKLNIRNVYLKRIQSIISNTQGVRSIGSCALALCYVAMGALDAYEVDTVSCWDTAAGALIIKEAGGTILSPDGSKFEIMSGNILAAATEALAEEFVEFFKIADNSLSS